jgi:NAD(P)-dependent dehydrogenase (short-subunit alcohol dehydrogenase family)
MTDSVRHGIALVTGASGGIGSAISKKLADDGYELVLTGRSEEKLSSLEVEIRRGGGSVSSYSCDLTDPVSVEALVKFVSGKGRLTALVNNAGKELLLPLQATRSDQICEILFANLFSTIYLTKCCLKLLKSGSSVVNVSSVSGIRGSAGMSVYAATKGALLSFTKSLASELASKGVRVNSVAPGMVETKMSERMMALQGDAYRDLIKAKHPLGLGVPEDVANTISFLVSDQARWITGEVVVIDGGYSV